MAARKQYAGRFFFIFLSSPFVLSDMPVRAFLVRLVSSSRSFSSHRIMRADTR